MKEKWTLIHNHDLYKYKYVVSNLGRIKRSKQTVTIIEGDSERTYIIPEKTPYLNVNARNGLLRFPVIYKATNRQTNLYVHKLVAHAFVPNGYEKPVVIHKDGNQKNNHATNLEWATYKEANVGRFRVGDDTPHEIVQNCLALSNKGRNNTEIATTLGLSVEQTFKLLRYAHSTKYLKRISRELKTNEPDGRGKDIGAS